MLHQLSHSVKLLAGQLLSSQFAGCRARRTQRQQTTNFMLKCETSLTNLLLSIGGSKSGALCHGSFRSLEPTPQILLELIAVSPVRLARRTAEVAKMTPGTFQPLRCDGGSCLKSLCKALIRSTSALVCSRSCLLASQVFRWYLCSLFLVSSVCISSLDSTLSPTPQLWAPANLLQTCNTTT